MESLFSDFEAISAKQWKQQLQFELKGKDYNNTLVWHSPDDIKVKPFYHAEDLTPSYPIETAASAFKVCQNIFVHDLQKSINRTNQTIDRGATAIRFTIQNPEIDIEKLLSETNLSGIPVYFNLGFLNHYFINKIISVSDSKNIDIHLNLDPIGHLARDGNWPQSAEKNIFEVLKNINSKTNLLSIDATLYQNAGANIVQELAFCMAHANEYFENIGSIKTTIVFEVALGSNYFFEIAKLRAYRLLFKTIANEQDHELDCQIIATPSKRNKTIYDYNTNLIRTTAECMASILGGANVVANLPYDSLYHKDNEFGDRIARNQLLILQKEASFDKVDNPTDGSYYIESLTQQLAEKALVLFKEIEQSGGFLKLLKDGLIQKKIAESHQKEQDLFDAAKIVLIGTNKFPNPNDHMQNDLELYPFLKINPRKTLVTPIIEKRLSEKIEQERLKNEK